MPRFGSPLHPKPVLVALTSLLTFACATRVDVKLSEDVDFSRYRTWGWDLPDARDPSEPASAEALHLASSLVNEIRRQMAARGFEYVGEEGDLLLRPDLRVERIRTTVHRTEGDRMLVSHHASPSYFIQGMTRPEVEVHERSWLEVTVTDRHRGEVVFEGELQGRFKGAFAPHMGASVAQLIGPLPAVAPAIVPSNRMLSSLERVPASIER